MPERRFTQTTPLEESLAKKARSQPWWLGISFLLYALLALPTKHVIEEARPYQDAERGPVERYGCTHEVNSRDGILTVRTNIVTDDETGIGPPDECGTFQAELIDDGGNVIRPDWGSV